MGWRVYEVARERGDGAASVGGAAAAVGVGDACQCKMMGRGPCIR